MRRETGQDYGKYRAAVRWTLCDHGTLMQIDDLLDDRKAKPNRNLIAGWLCGETLKASDTRSRSAGDKPAP